MHIVRVTNDNHRIKIYTASDVEILNTYIWKRTQFVIMPFLHMSTNMMRAVYGINLMMPEINKYNFT